ncbi:N-acetyltransferase, partial [Pantoea sp. M_5]
MSTLEKYEWHKDNYLVSTDRKRLDVQAIHRYLTRSTWAKGIDRNIVSLSIENSLNFGVYHDDAQIGFARLITDYATFAYL